MNNEEQKARKKRLSDLLNEMVDRHFNGVVQSWFKASGIPPTHNYQWFRRSKRFPTVEHFSRLIKPLPAESKVVLLRAYAQASLPDEFFEYFNVSSPHESDDYSKREQVKLGKTQEIALGHLRVVSEESTDMKKFLRNFHNFTTPKI